MNYQKRLITLMVLLLGLLAGGLTGCSATSPYMTEVASPQAPTAAPDKATVVFVRPSSWGKAMKITIIDDKGNFVGDSLPSSYFVKKVSPGKHLFITWAENTDGLEATLEAGKIYFVEIEIKMGAWSARSHLKALSPKSERWSKRQEWLSESTELQVDEAGGQAYIEGRRDDANERVRRAHEAMGKYDAGDLAERTLGPGDGI